MTEASSLKSSLYSILPVPAFAMAAFDVKFPMRTKVIGGSSSVEE